MPLDLASFHPSSTPPKTRCSLVVVLPPAPPALPLALLLLMRAVPAAARLLPYPARATPPTLPRPGSRPLLQHARPLRTRASAAPAPALSHAPIPHSRARRSCPALLRPQRLGACSSYSSTSSTTLGTQLSHPSRILAVLRPLLLPPSAPLLQRARPSYPPGVSPSRPPSARLSRPSAFAHCALQRGPIRNPDPVLRTGPSAFQTRPLGSARPRSGALRDASTGIHPAQGKLPYQPPCQTICKTVKGEFNHKLSHYRILLIVSDTPTRTSLHSPSSALSRCSLLTTHTAVSDSQR